jgi:hypothetical protein
VPVEFQVLGDEPGIQTWAVGYSTSAEDSESLQLSSSLRFSDFLSFAVPIAAGAASLLSATIPSDVDDNSVVVHPTLAPPDADTVGESLLWRIVIPFAKSNFCCVYTSFSRSIFPTRAWPFRRLMRTFEHHAALERWILPFQLQSCPSPANSPRSCPTTPTAPAPHQTFVTPSVR